MTASPSHEQQASFFTKLQYLLTEGEFVSTYKYALLLALTRWAVANADHDESRPLDVAELTQHFVALYWPQARVWRHCAGRVTVGSGRSLRASPGPALPSSVARRRVTGEVHPGHPARPILAPWAPPGRPPETPARRMQLHCP